MSFTESGYGERFFELDREIDKQLNLENAKRQYKELCEGGDNINDPSVGLKSQTFEEWYESGNYDPSDWG